jgi:hypothetical protein
MRRIAVLVLSLLTVGGAALAGALAPAGAQRVASTRITVVRPVDASGHARPGFTVASRPTADWVDCSFRFPSLAAVSPDIEWCTPTALSPVACWKAAAAHKALCLIDARGSELVRYARRGAFAPTDLARARMRAPLTIKLADGDICQIRAGGAWGTPPGHPHLIGYYGCDRDGAVWAKLGAAHNGIDESQPMWTVRTAQFTSHRIVTHQVVRAWFVGTSHH